MIFCMVYHQLRIIKMSWLVKIEVETKADAEKVERVVDSMSRSEMPIKLHDIEFEELD